MNDWSNQNGDNADIRDTEKPERLSSQSWVLGRSEGDADESQGPNKSNPKAWAADGELVEGTGTLGYRLGRTNAKTKEPQSPGQITISAESFSKAIAEAVEAGKEAENERLLKLLETAGAIRRLIEDPVDGYYCVTGLDDQGYLVIKHLGRMTP